MTEKIHVNSYNRSPPTKQKRVVLKQHLEPTKKRNMTVEEMYEKYGEKEMERRRARRLEQYKLSNKSPTMRYALKMHTGGSSRTKLTPMKTKTKVKLYHGNRMKW